VEGTGIRISVGEFQQWLEATRAQSEKRYAEVESWAWARLNQRLRAVRARRARLRPAAA